MLVLLTDYYTNQAVHISARHVVSIRANHYNEGKGAIIEFAMANQDGGAKALVTEDLQTVVNRIQNALNALRG